MKLMQKFYKLIIVRYLYKWDLLCLIKAGRVSTARWPVARFNHVVLLQWNEVLSPAGFTLFCKIEKLWHQMFINLKYRATFSLQTGLALVLFVCFIFVLFIFFLICCEILRLNIHINQYLRNCKLYDEINVSMPNIKFVYYNYCKYCVFNKM